jgi:predicted dehydrogenase
MWRADRQESPLGGMGGMGIHMVDMIINLAGRFREVTVRSHARVSTTIDDTTAMLGMLESGVTVGFATLALAPRLWRVALFGNQGSLELSGHERLTFTPVEGEGWVKEYPKTDIEAAELAAFAAAASGGAPRARALRGAGLPDGGSPRLPRRRLCGGLRGAGDA